MQRFIKVYRSLNTVQNCLLTIRIYTPFAVKLVLYCLKKNCNIHRIYNFITVTPERFHACMARDFFRQRVARCARTSIEAEKLRLPGQVHQRISGGLCGSCVSYTVAAGPHLDLQFYRTCHCRSIAVINTELRENKEPSLLVLFPLHAFKFIL